MTDTSKTVLPVQNIPEKPPMVIEMNVITPVGMSIEETFATIKKIDEIRDFNHELHLRVACELGFSNKKTFAEKFSELTHSTPRRPFD